LASREPTPEELLRRLKVSDLLLSTLPTLLQLGFAKLADRELEQARLAIESLRALTPLLEGFAPDEALRDLRQATANLQLAYASAAAEAAPEQEPEPADAAPEPAPESEPEPEPAPEPEPEPELDGEDDAAG
jgi:outer membrane biosynthesis protein TonB